MTRRLFGAILLLWAGLPAASAAATLEMKDGWIFHEGDDPAWAERVIDLTGWQPISVTTSWGRQGFGEVQDGWYRQEIVLDESFPIDETLGLSFGRVWTSYEVWADGQRIGAGGRLPPLPTLEYDRLRTFTLPASLLIDRHLVVAVRVHRAKGINQVEGGLIGAPPRLGQLDELYREQSRRQLPYLVLAAVFLVVGIYHLLLYRHRPISRDYSVFGLLALVQSAYVFLISPGRFALFEDFVLLKEIEYQVRFLLPVLAIQFLWPFFGKTIHWSLRAYQLSFVAMAAAVIGPGLELNLAVVRIFEVWLAPLFIAIPTLIIQKYRAGDPDGRTLSLAGIVTVLTFINDILVGRGLLMMPILSLYGFAIFTLAVAWTLSTRFSRVYFELDELRQGLEQRVEQRTHELADARDAALAASRAKSDFLANISHEIRTPMAGILGVNELLLKTPLADEQRRLGETIQGSAVALLGIVDDLLDFSKIEARKLKLDIGEHDLGKIVESVFELLAPAAATKGLKFERRVDRAVPAAVRVDGKRLRQILLNLVGNAVKFTDKGRVSLRVQPGDRPDVLHFEVEDSGIGIEEAVIPRLFAAFEQADSAANRRFEGTGLGLAISRHLVEAMGGTIAVKSRIGQGSIFSFSLPMTAVDLPQSQPTGNSPLISPASRKKILVAEDNPVNQLLIQRFVEALGHEAVLTANGDLALMAYDKDHFDVILMDCQMPGKDGYETTRLIREREADRRHTPVIAVTAHAMVGERERCLAAGMDDYLTKPFNLEHLQATLSRWLLDEKGEQAV